MMNFKLNWVLSLTLLFCTVVSIAQPVRVSTVEQMLEVAAECEAAGDYVNAIEWYDNAYKENKDYSLTPKLAELYVKTRNYERAQGYYERIFKREREENQFLQFRKPYADVLKAMGEYQMALDNYKIVLANNPSDEVKASSILAVEGINQYNGLLDNVEVAIKPAKGKVNNASAESKPVEYEDGTLYFSSFDRRKAIDYADVETDYHMKIYTAKAEGKEYGKPVALDDAINRQNFHTSNPTFSKDGREMYFTRTKMDGPQIEGTRLYRSLKTDEGWKAPIEIETLVNEETSSVKHPALGELFGQRVLYFVSDMPGGKGGFDIYYATITGDAEFSAPVNLGDVVNTAGDDVTPFYQDGTLYYSSDGLPTIGGFDIFSSKWNGEVWANPENMGKGYNSSFDDLYLSFSKEMNRGYLVSNRPSDGKRKISSETCCDDIFTVEIREVVIDLLATVNDENGALNGANIKLKNLTTSGSDESKKETTTNQFQFLLDGDQKYRVVVDKEGYFPDSLEFTTAGIIDDYTVNKTFTLKSEPKAVVETPKPPSTTDKPGFKTETVITNQAIRLNNIYYDLDDDKILKASEKDLNFLKELMEQYPSLVIELSSHTDSRGRDAYNMDLSQRRSESAKKWLVKKGIDKSRIVPKGYGETLLINQCSNGVKCDDDTHRQNRRTEFKILEGPTTIQITREISSPYQGGGQSFFIEPDLSRYFQDTTLKYPDFEFSDDHFNLGEVQIGDKKSMLYTFTNNGEADLIIELVTACKCTMLEWTKEVIPPGGKGEIFVQYDSKDGKEGDFEKVVDVIANTKQVVNEIRFSGTHVSKVKEEGK